MSATPDDVTKKIKPEPSAEQPATEDLVRRTREQGLSLCGPDGLVKQLTKTVLETALNQELQAALHGIGPVTLNWTVDCAARRSVKKQSVGQAQI